MSVNISIRGQQPPQEILDHEILVVWMSQTNGVIYLDKDGWQTIGNVLPETLQWANGLSNVTFVISDQSRQVGKFQAEQSYSISDDRCRELHRATYG